VETYSSLDTVSKEIGEARQETATEHAKLHGEMKSMKDDITKFKQELNPTMSKAIDVVSFQNIRDQVPHYTEYDRRLNFTSQTRVQLKGTLDGVGEITCLEIDETFPRVVRIYSRIAARIQVQGFYGILEKSGRKYAIMEDIAAYPTLDTAVKERKLGSTSSKLRVAYEIASAMAYLHHVGLLLKSLSGASVVVKTVNGDLRPVITGLKYGRLVLRLRALRL
jgi:hypothetical protein